MSSVVEISRMALSHIGSDTFIQSIDEDSKEAKTCKTFFDSSLNSLLRQFEWNFATQKLALTLFGTSSSDFAYQYKYPNTCLFARRIIPIEKTQTVEFSIVNDGGVKVIQTDLKNAVLEFTKKIDDTELLDPLFVDVLALKLARNIITPLSGDKSRLEIINSLYVNSLYEAKASDGNEGQSQEPQNAEWIRVRF